MTIQECIQKLKPEVRATLERVIINAGKDNDYFEILVHAGWCAWDKEQELLRTRQKTEGKF